MKPQTKKSALWATTALVLTIAIAGSGYYFTAHQASAKDTQEQAQPQAMPVTVEITQKKPVQIWNEFSAHLEAVDYAQIRPQVSGTITEVRFEDGQEVTAGDILFVIDPRPYKATVNSAEADLIGAQNEATLAQKELDRANELIKTNAISKRILDERTSAARVANANVKRAQARLEQAKVDLDYAYVKAPISGRVSRVEITEGNLVSAGPNAPLLTSIVSDNGIYADFEVDESTYLTYVRSTAKDRASENQIPVKLQLSGDTKEYDGTIYSFDNRIDSTSGTIRGRALFANKDGALLPGMFAKIQMGSATDKNQILITEKAIGTNQDRRFVYVVGDDNIVAYREVKIGESVGGARVILSGLESNEKVITEGVIRIRPGMPVSPQTQQEIDSQKQAAKATADEAAEISQAE